MYHGKDIAGFLQCSRGISRSRACITGCFSHVSRPDTPRYLAMSVRYTARQTNGKMDALVACELSARTYGSNQWWVLLQKTTR